MPSTRVPSTRGFRVATAALIGALALATVATNASETTETSLPSFGFKVEYIASGIVEGEVVDQQYVTTASGAQTETTVRVDDWHRGSGPEVITVVTEGGVTDKGLIHNVSHQPALDVGADVQLALLDWGPSRIDRAFSVVGGTAGALNATTGEQVPTKIITTSAELQPDYQLNGDSWIFPLAAPIEFKINPNTADVSGNGESNAINNAVAAWEAASGIDFTNTGTSSINVADPNDFINTIFWAATPNPAHTFLAKASWYEYVNAPGEIVGFDVHFNTDHQWATSATTGRFDIESVALHEIGHAIGLDHTASSAEVMFSSLTPATLHRTLGSGDVAGAQLLYPDASVQTCVGVVANVVGTHGDDTLTGSDEDDVFVGLGGNDTIYGLGGNDLVCAGSGHDIVHGGGGNDIVYGQNGSDSLRGDNGNDELFGGVGYDDLQGGDGNDRLQGAGGNDTLRGGNGDDVLWGKPGDDEMHGDAGNDEIYAASGNDLAYGGLGHDSIQGAGGDDELHGGDGDDVLFGQNDHDDLYGDSGDDIIYAAAGNDTIEGGTGADNLQGGGGNDIIDGGADNDILYGQSGVNILDGGTGADECFAGGIGSTMTSC